MRLYTWNQLDREFKKYPDKITAVANHPPKEDCATFDEVLTIDDTQCDIIAEVIGCQCASSMKKQQEEAMAIWKTVWDTPREWIEATTAEEENSIPADFEMLIRKITSRYSRTKQCHRNWIGERAGIRCYCDTHNHKS